MTRTPQRPRIGLRTLSGRPDAQFAALCALVAMALLAVAASGLIRDLRLSIGGHDTPARIVALTERTVRNGLTRALVFDAVLQFTDTQGTEQQESFRVSRRFFGTHVRGQTVMLRYLPGNPSVGRLASDGTSQARPVPGMLGLGFAILASVLAAITWRRLAPMRRAARSGMPIAAQVTAHAPTEPPSLKWARIAWRDGAGQEGLTGRVHRDDLPSMGAAVTLYADPVTGQRWWDGEF